MARGGSRPGAGRPPAGLPSASVVKRIPREIAEDFDRIENLLQIISKYRRLSSEASPTSPRWQKLREMLAELDE